MGRSDPQSIEATIRGKYLRAALVLTLGEKGAMYFGPDSTWHETAEQVTVIDTTAAGDTFIGYFVTGMMRGQKPQDCLRMACRAAALCVTRKGAADSIPRKDELNVTYS